MSEHGLDRFLADRRERKARADRIAAEAHTAEVRRYAAKMEQIKAEQRAKRRAELEQRQAAAELARARPDPPPPRPRTEPPMVACSRCSHPVVVSKTQKKTHRSARNPRGDPHYCLTCLRKLDPAA